jgi:hypothetical protein
MSDYPGICLGGGLKKSRRKVGQDNQRTCHFTNTILHCWTHLYHREKTSLIGRWSKEQKGGLKSLNIISVNQKATPTCSADFFFPLSLYYLCFRLVLKFVLSN